MKERKQIYKTFEGKKILIITQSNFKYHTSNLQVFSDCVKFTDNRDQEIFLDINEIKFIQEVSGNGS